MVYKYFVFLVKFSYYTNKFNTEATLLVYIYLVFMNTSLFFPSRKIST